MSNQMIAGLVIIKLQARSKKNLERALELEKEIKRTDLSNEEHAKLFKECFTVLGEIQLWEYAMELFQKYEQGDFI